MKDDDKKLPASARPIADENGRTVDLHYSRGQIEDLKRRKRAGAKIKLPPGVTLDDDAPAADSTESR